MTTDIVLLKLAAKAAKLKIRFDRAGVAIRRTWQSGENKAWNPLKFDGDALRLAVKLKMEVGLWSNKTTATADDVSFVTEMHGNDPYAATRRAIVRTAAALAPKRACEDGLQHSGNTCEHGLHMDNACGACTPPRGTQP